MLGDVEVPPTTNLLAKALTRYTNLFTIPTSVGDLGYLGRGRCLAATGPIASRRT